MTYFFGNITKDAITRNSKQLDEKGNPVPVTSFTVAENYKVGEKECVRYHTIELWGSRGTKLARYLYAGRPVFVDQAYEDACVWMDADRTVHPYLRSRNPQITFVTANRATGEPVEPVVDPATVPAEDLPFEL